MSELSPRHKLMDFNREHHEEEGRTTHIDRYQPMCSSFLSLALDYVIFPNSCLLASLPIIYVDDILFLDTK